MSCELLQPIVRSEGGTLMDAQGTVSIDGGLVHEITHNQTAVYEPETERKPYILTVQAEGQVGLEEVGERALEEFAFVVDR